MNNYFMGSHHLAPLDRCPMAPASITLVVSTPFTCCNCCTKLHHLWSYLSYLSYLSSHWCPLHLPGAPAAQNCNIKLNHFHQRWQHFHHWQGWKRKALKQDPVSTMQKTCLENYSSFLVRSRLEKGITQGCDRYLWGNQQPFSCV